VGMVMVTMVSEGAVKDPHNTGGTILKSNVRVNDNSQLLGPRSEEGN